MKKFSDRLLYFIENHLNMNISEFEKKLKVANGTMYRAIKGHNIGLDKIQLISDVFPELNMDWLISGEGSMINNNEYDGSTKAEEDNPPKYEKASQIDRVIDELSKTISIINTLTESNKIMAESNKTISNAVNTIAESNKELITKIK